MKIAKARKMMRRAFKKDPAYRKHNQNNISMLIYDDQHSGKPTNLRQVAGCDYIADCILKLIFD